jgi:hypothetical protein
MNAAIHNTGAKLEAELIQLLEDALTVLQLPDCDISREDGKTAASYSYKCGYAKGAIKGALKELRSRMVPR